MNSEVGEPNKTYQDTNPEIKYILLGGFWKNIPDGASPECLDMDTEVFFPDAMTRAVRPEVCLSCGITAFCLAQSIRMGETKEGIWGAAVPHERMMLAKMMEPRRSEAIAAFVRAIKHNPAPAAPGKLPGRDPLPPQQKKPAATEQPAPSEVNLDTLNPHSNPIAANTSNRRVSKPIEQVYEATPQFEEGSEDYYEHASRALGLHTLNGMSTMRTADWIAALRAVETHGKDIEVVAEQHNIPTISMRYRIQTMRVALKKCSPQLRDKLLGISAA